MNGTLHWKILGASGIKGWLDKQNEKGMMGEMMKCGAYGIKVVQIMDRINEEIHTADSSDTNNASTEVEDSSDEESIDDATDEEVKLSLIHI